MKKEVAAYIAGIIDGEGCISICRNNSHTGRWRTPRYSVEVTVTNTSEALMVELQKWYPAAIRIRKRERSHWKECWAWKATALKAKDLLTFVLPYLIVKRKQAELALLFLDSVTDYRKNGHKLMPQEEYEMREAFYQMSRQLNRAPAETEYKSTREGEATVRTVGKLTEEAEMTSRSLRLVS